MRRYTAPRLVFCSLVGSIGLSGFFPTAEAQETVTHVTSPVSPDSRFVIVQANQAAKYTFRLDKVSGKVDLLVTTSKQDLTWEAIPRLEHRLDQSNGKAIYQMFISGLAARFTFLINTATGATWQLTQDTGQGGGYFFNPLQ